MAATNGAVDGCPNDDARRPDNAIRTNVAVVPSMTASQKYVDTIVSSKSGRRMTDALIPYAFTSEKNPTSTVVMPVTVPGQPITPTAAPPTAAASPISATWWSEA